jgi:hypothetical protein
MRKTCRTGRAGDLGAGIAQFVFSKALCARLSRQLMIPRIEVLANLAPAVPSMARLRVCSAHHGEERGCRRACERTPLRGRRRCAAGGSPRQQGYVPVDLLKASCMHKFVMFSLLLLSMHVEVHMEKEM